ncbi:antirestriction protein [Rouxiella silvae]|jgi:hypothetical protein|uniref:antirestriction protein n=1 Tax=Rouxiella silvae TaxID=1646373 RepID=UPI0039F0FB76
MNNSSNTECSPDEDGLALFEAIKKNLGIRSDLKLEVFANQIFRMAECLSPDYEGDYWKARMISDSVCYLVPTLRPTWSVRVNGNYFEGEMSSDAFGITVTLFVLNQIANTTEQEKDITIYYALRNYALDHQDAALIMAAID